MNNDEGMTGAAVDTDETQNIDISISKEEREKMMYPDEIAGVKRGKPMSFEEAGGENANPHYFDGEEYWTNCQSAAVAYDARRKGFNVTAAGYKPGNKSDELSLNFFNAWVDPETGIPCEGQNIDADVDCYDYLNEMIHNDERYVFTYAMDRDFEGQKEVTAHVRTIDKNENGQLRVYDPQSGTIMTTENEVRDYFEKWGHENGNYKPKILRVDDKGFNSYYINDVVVRGI